MFKILFIFFLFVSSDAFAKRIAVLDLSSSHVDAEVLTQLADDVRSGALLAVKNRTLDGEKITLMTRENMMDVLQSMGKDASCVEGSCEVEIGRNISADFVITGQLLNVNGTYVLSLKVHETENGNLLAADKINSEDMIEMMADAVMLGSRITRQALGLRRGGSKVNEGRFGGGSDWVPEQGEKEILVKFASTPRGATVLLDDQLLCDKTPCSRYMAPGSHDVRFELQRHRAFNDSFKVRKGLKVSGTLEPLFGWYSLETEPSGLDILLDGNRAGRTPIRKKEINPGIHKVEVNSRCHHPEGYRFQISAGQHKDDIEVLAPAVRKSAIKVLAYSGEDALEGDVYVDGKSLGRTGETITVPFCSRKVQLRTDDGRTWTRRLNLKEEEVQRLEAQLSASRTYRKNKRQRNSTGNTRKNTKQTSSGLPNGWTFSLGYSEAVHQITNGPSTEDTSGYMSLENGYIAYNDGTSLNDYYIPIKPNFNGKKSQGVRIGIGALVETWYGNLNIDATYLPEGNQLHKMVVAEEEYPLLVYYSHLDINFELGYVMPSKFFRPTVGFAAGGGYYSGNIVDVESGSSWIDEGARAYSTVSTEYTDDGDPKTPVVERLLFTLGPTVGFLLQNPTWPGFMSFQWGYKLSSQGSFYQFGVSFSYLGRD